MDDVTKDPMSMKRPLNARRPLMGLTLLLVEDSRFCSEAVRLMCLASGARLRRADCVNSARRHLATYRPSAALVDLGLPDGSGIEIIRDMDDMSPRVPVIIGMSGQDPAVATRAARDAGADEFLPKPLPGLAVFQESILRHMPDRDEMPLRALPDGRAQPDQQAFCDDLRHVRGLIDDAAREKDPALMAYAAQFLRSVATEAADGELTEAARGVVRLRGAPGNDELIELIDKRLADRPVL